MSSDSTFCCRLAKDNLDDINAVSELFEVESARLKSFLEDTHNFAFIADYNGETAGFVYGYSLMSLDSAPQLFVYSADVLPKLQNMRIGSRLFQFVVDYCRENGFSECFVITDKGNKRACRIYEKAGGKNDYEDEIVYVVKFDKED